VPRRNVRIAAGLKSRWKRVVIEGCERLEATDKLKTA